MISLDPGVGLVPSPFLDWFVFNHGDPYVVVVDTLATARTPEAGRDWLVACFAGTRIGPGEPRGALSRRLIR